MNLVLLLFAMVPFSTLYPALSSNSLDGPFAAWKQSVFMESFEALPGGEAPQEVSQYATLLGLMQTEDPFLSDSALDGLLGTSELAHAEPNNPLHCKDSPLSTASDDVTSTCPAPESWKTLLRDKLKLKKETDDKNALPSAPVRRAGTKDLTMRKKFS